MTTYYFDSNNTAGGRDGTLGNPFASPSELPSSYVMVGGDTYLFRRGTSYNFTTSLRNASATTGSAGITVGAWGEGERPIVTLNSTVGTGDCFEIATPTTVSGKSVIVATPGAGVNLWAVPATFFGLFSGKVWGVCVDSTNAAGAGEVLPSAPYEWAGSPLDRKVWDGATYYAIVYSVGNPVTYYGGLYKTAVTYSNFFPGPALQEHGVITSVKCTVGFNISGIEFADSIVGLMMFTATAGTDHARFLQSGHSISDCVFRNCFDGTSIAGNSAMVEPVGYTGLRCYNNYYENIGRCAINTPTAGQVLNSSIIRRNVINGACKAYSQGAIYLLYTWTTDGSVTTIEENSISDVASGNYWPTDGFAIYQEVSARNILVRRNFVWNTTLPYQNNLPSAGYTYTWQQNVAVAKATTDIAFHVTASNAACKITWIGNVGVGYKQLIGVVQGYQANKYHIERNVATSSGVGGSDNAGVLINQTDASGALACVPTGAMSGNNFYGFTNTLRNSCAPASDQSASSSVTGAISSDPSAQIDANVPNPTNPKTNYALQISPNFWSGTVNLRRGMGRVAA